MTTIEQAHSAPLFIGWENPERSHSTVIEKVSSIFAYTILWIRSFYDQEISTVFQIFQYDTCLFNPIPNHTLFIKTRQLLITLVNQSSPDHIEKQLQCLDWKELSDIQRIDPINAQFLFKKTQTIDPKIKTQIHHAFVVFKKNIHSHCCTFSSTWNGLSNNRSYQHSKEQLKSALSLLQMHFENSCN